MEYPLVDARQWELVPFRDYPEHDSIWSLARGADGHIYIGLCCEHTGGGVAQLFRYNVGARKLEHRADMAKVTGEPAAGGRATQGKIHFSLCPDADGLLYGATHCTTPPLGHRVWNPYGMWDDPAHSYPGGHLFRHDTRTGETVDFGILFPNQGIPFLLLDEARGRLYGVTYPKAHFFRANLLGRDVADYGRISSWYPIAMEFDARGNVFTSDSNSQLIKYDAARDRVLFLRATPYAHPWNRSKRFSWMSNLNRAEDGMIYGTHYCNDHLFRFDPRAARPRIEDLGPGLPGEAATMLRCLAPDGRGHIYYEATLKSPAPGGAARVWVRYALRDGRKEALGGLIVRGTPVSSWIGVRDREGNIYMKGGRPPGRASRPMTLAVFRPKGSCRRAGQERQR